MRKLSFRFATVLGALTIMVSACITDHLVPAIVSQKDLKLSIYQENPGKTGIASNGSADVSYDRGTKMLSYTIKWNDLTGIPSGAHIHGTAPRGTNTGIVHDFATLIEKKPTGSFSNQVLVDEVKIKEADLLNGLYYFNFHTAANAGGEIRGQIEFYDQPTVVSKMGLVLSPSQEVPAKSSPATGWADVVYNKTTKTLGFTMVWNNLTDVPTGAHIHGPAAAGTNASIQADFFSLIPKTTSGSFSYSVPVDGVKIVEADLLAGKYYFNMHTPLNPGGEIRGQIVF